MSSVPSVHWCSYHVTLTAHAPGYHFWTPPDETRAQRFADQGLGYFTKQGMLDDGLMQVVLGRMDGKKLTHEDKDVVS